MPIAVLDVDFDNLPTIVTGLEHYSSALVLIRMHRRPVGQALLPVVNGQIGCHGFRDCLMEYADWSFWENWLIDYLGLMEQDENLQCAPKASIAICTRDRPTDLKRCLDSLMLLPDDGQEILVVDNCPSTDKTRQLVNEYGCVRYVLETRPGLNIARNRAMYEAQNDIVAFTDDDATPDPGWLRAMVKNFYDPNILCVTGLTMPIELETDAQEWFQRLGGFRRGFKRIVLDSTECHPLEGWYAGAGVNMALHRNLLSCVGPFDERLDVGTPTFAGGDNEIFCRILSHGYRIIYEPMALNWHRHRYAWAQLRRQFYGYGVGSFAASTRSLIIEKEFDVAKIMSKCFYSHFPSLISHLFRRPGGTPLSLIFLNYLGFFVGPWAYIYSYFRNIFSKRN